MNTEPKQTKGEEMYLTLVNGNISDFRKWCTTKKRYFAAMDAAIAACDSATLNKIQQIFNEA